MPRPRRIRRIFFEPGIDFFKPAGVMMRNLKENILTKDELEAVRFIDYEKIEQSKVAKKMKISQPTLSRLLSSARKKIADSLVNGKAIRIKGGNYKMVRPRGGRFRAPASGGRGRMQGFAAGPGGICKCPKCGYEQPQIRSQPCMNKKCPKCGTRMTRG
jgi:predicted DNA-binding protein (UPF0251 family)